MKVEIEIECTPEEARRFLGLPDVQPMQVAMVEEMQRRMMANLEAMEPEALMRSWLPLGMQGLESVQKAFWSQLNKAMSDAQGKAKAKGEGKPQGKPRSDDEEAPR